MGPSSIPHPVPVRPFVVASPLPLSSSSCFPRPRCNLTSTSSIGSTPVLSSYHSIRPSRPRIGHMRALSALSIVSSCKHFISICPFHLLLYLPILVPSFFLDTWCWIPFILFVAFFVRLFGQFNYLLLLLLSSSCFGHFSSSFFGQCSSLLFQL